MFRYYSMIFSSEVTPWWNSTRNQKKEYFRCSRPIQNGTSHSSHRYRRGICFPLQLLPHLGFIKNASPSFRYVCGLPLCYASRRRIHHGWHAHDDVRLGVNIAWHTRHKHCTVILKWDVTHGFKCGTKMENPLEEWGDILCRSFVLRSCSINCSPRRYR